MKFKDKYNKTMKALQSQFKSNFKNMDIASSELFLMLIIGCFQGWETVHEVSQKLGIPKDNFYKQLHKYSLSRWRNLFRQSFRSHSIKILSDLCAQSAASWSRAEVSIAIDDSVIRKYGRHLSYNWLWWSGQWKQVVSGYDVLMVSLKVKGQIIPIDFWLMSKRGACNNRHRRLEVLMNDLAKDLLEAGIDVARIPLSADAAFADHKLVDCLRNAGFKKIVIGAKSNYCVRRKEKAEKSQYLKEVFTHEKLEQETSDAWGIKDEQVILEQVYSPTFGKLKVLARYVLGKMRYYWVWGIERTCEAFRINKRHHWVEVLFKRLKSLLCWGKYRLRSSEGAYATVVMPLMAYFVLLQLQSSLKMSCESIVRTLQQWAMSDFDGFIEASNIEHFQSKISLQDLFTKL